MRRSTTAPSLGNRHAPVLLPVRHYPAKSRRRAFPPISCARPLPPLRLPTSLGCLISPPLALAWVPFPPDLSGQNTALAVASAAWQRLRSRCLSSDRAGVAQMIQAGCLVRYDDFGIGLHPGRYRALCADGRRKGKPSPSSCHRCRLICVVLAANATTCGSKAANCTFASCSCTSSRSNDGCSFGFGGTDA